MSEVIELKKKEAIKELLLAEARLSTNLAEKGIFFNKEEITKHRIAKSGLNSVKGGDNLSFKLPHGIGASGHFTPWTPYSIVVENGNFILYDDKTPIGEITFSDRAPNPLLDALLSDGQRFRNILSLSEEAGSVSVGYSKECALKETGEDCLFCIINVGDGKYTERLHPILTPKIVAEAYGLARKAGLANHFKISGGFVPERRELEYYLDVAEEIVKKYPDFYGAAVIGAPADLTILKKYKDAGYQNLSHNLEIWDKNIFAAICPGKDKRNGGQQHWIKSLEAAVDIFGKGHVDSNIIAGLEPKSSLLEGLEYLASKGIVARSSRFRPIPGTPLEGYRSPTADFHWEIVDKLSDIYIRYGFTLNQLTGKAAANSLPLELFRIKTGDFEGDKLTTWKYPALKIPE